MNIKNSKLQFLIQFSVQNLHYLIILAGVLLRLYFYFQNKSLWLDECWLSSNIINRDFNGLTKPLNDLQMAPLGFLFSLKIITIIFGISEYALRLLPLIVGVLLLFFAYKTVLSIENKIVALGVLAFLCFSPALIHFSNCVKQYSVDLFATIISFYILFSNKNEILSIKRIKILGFAGFILIWFSYTVAITLFGIGIVLFLYFVQRKEYDKLKQLIYSISIWLLSFSIFYFVSLKANSNIALQQDVFGDRGDIPRLFSFGPNYFKIIYLNISTFFFVVIDIPYAFNFMFVLYFIGLFFSKSINKVFYIICSLIGVTIYVISNLGYYPWVGRLLLFLALISITPCISGLYKLVGFFKYKTFVFSVIIIFISLFLINKSRKYKDFTDNRPVYNDLKVNLQNDEKIFVFSHINCVDKYYVKRFIPEETVYYHETMEKDTTNFKQIKKGYLVVNNTYLSNEFGKDQQQFLKHNTEKISIFKTYMNCVVFKINN